MTFEIVKGTAPPVPPVARRAVRLRTPGDVRRCLAAVANDMMRGKMDPVLGGRIGYVLSVLLRSIETDEIEARLDALEKKGRSDAAN